MGFHCLNFSTVFLLANGRFSGSRFALGRCGARGAPAAQLRGLGVGSFMVAFLGGHWDVRQKVSRDFCIITECVLMIVKIVIDHAFFCMYIYI